MPDADIADVEEFIVRRHTSGVFSRDHSREYLAISFSEMAYLC